MILMEMPPVIESIKSSYPGGLKFLLEQEGFWNTMEMTMQPNLELHGTTKWKNTLESIKVGFQGSFHN